MQGMPGALQVCRPPAWCPNNKKELNVFGSLDLRVTQVAQATTFFQQALLLQYGPGTFSEGGLRRRVPPLRLRRSPPLRGA